MSNKDTVFYRGRTAINMDFSADAVSSDGAVLLLEKLERKHRILHYFSQVVPDCRDPFRIVHPIDKLLKQRVFTMVQGYEDANDVQYLKNDPLLKDILEGGLASQPTMSRFENGFDKHSVFALCNAWVDRYVLTLAGREQLVIDIDGTDDPTHGEQQLSMFNGYYGQFMYNELFFHDGDTGQIILPVLRPGNSHSNKWYVAILKRILKKIRAAYPGLKIIVRADSGFSCPAFYQLADDFGLKFAVGIAANETLKKKTARAEKAVRHLFVSNNTKHQHFISYTYQAGTWHKPQQCYSKIESTGKGLNVRHIVSNMEEADARSIYFGFYVKRGEASENRIKEVKNMCFSDRLSDHGFWPNFFRLFLSSLSYEIFLLVKEAIKKTGFEAAKKWQVDTIRASLLKIGATIKTTKRKVYYRFSKAFVHQELFRQLVFQ
ncbi:IS1380 family transposase [Prolixibacter sp. SD074]|uniref:IS1380 family transposase n=1 Tax=Prolixibacter sp. SD074 TaxID=2652391 RepID=UPI0012994F1E|nr:IS1380 family transposase [Prolixibacter sp. SD074]